MEEKLSERAETFTEDIFKLGFERRVRLFSSICEMWR